MLSLTHRFRTLSSSLCSNSHPFRSFRTDARPSRRHSKPAPFTVNKPEHKSEWWAVDGEMHEIGDNVPPRERFIIPRENLPNRRRKQLREQFMRRTRLVLKESEHDPWCKKYMELYQELRENWERLYWDEGYSKKLARDHANYESAEEEDFSPYRNRQSTDRNKEQDFRRNVQGGHWENVSQIRDKFEYDRERRMKERAFAPMHGDRTFPSQIPRWQRTDVQPQRYMSESDSD
ncbi:uncharacterized protein LOC101219919 [Cucumis sativus]|uniref:Uncharacterized protein n=1 Tax=Cucumis sativus TaxID=3659 RepID=A0A0A0K4R1_CUCSA|nr:uncharacterized protein LOC101219919 [Cucumis sativus]KGN44695.1 hypothetical protein Csa_016219 [Cucumis sativus]